MITIWKGKMDFWFEVLDAFSANGIRYSADHQRWIIKVAEDQVDQANGVLMESILFEVRSHKTVDHSL